ncbi:MAG: hypothetical protein LC747_08325, partial [Acidobacteria bacterium]|nr:hypothetical protein [Acidobacteriota bacterium]
TWRRRQSKFPIIPVVTVSARWPEAITSLTKYPNTKPLFTATPRAVTIQGAARGNRLRSFRRLAALVVACFPYPARINLLLTQSAMPYLFNAIC